MRDGSLRRLAFAHALSAVGEWAVTVGVLVHAFAWGGSGAVGIVSLAVLVPPFAFAPLVGAAMGRWRPFAIRSVAVAIQVVAYGVAATLAVTGAATPALAPLVVVGLAATTTMHPTGAALLPRVARSTDELVGANLWITHSDSASALAGSLVAGSLVGAGGPEAVFAAGASLAAAGLLATRWRPAQLARTYRVSATTTTGKVVRDALAELRARPWSKGVLGAASARNLVVGAYDVLLVVVALEALGLGPGGPGYLSALVGAGAMASTVVTRFVVRRARLRGALMASIGGAAAGSVVLALWTDAPVVYCTLPFMGAAAALMDSLSRTLLQRACDPRHLGPLFAALGFVAGLGQLVGSALAQTVLAVGGLRGALVALGATLVVLTILSMGSLRRADAHAEVPVVEMALLTRVPTFAALPTVALEQVARLAETTHVAAGEALMVEGEPGDECFVIADGEFEMTKGGAHQRTVGRGDTVGEVALLANLPRTSTVTARRAGAALAIGREPFLVALSGRDVGSAQGDGQHRAARERYRRAVVAHEQDPVAHDTAAAGSWLALAAAGRALGDPSFAAALTRSAALAQEGSDASLLAEAAALTTWPGAFFFIAENPDYPMIQLCEAALATLSPEDPLRVRVLATLASHLTFASEPGRRAALITEAAALAARHGDPGLMGTALNAEFICLWEPGSLERRREIGPALVDIAAATGDAELGYLGRFFTAYCAAESGLLVEARGQLHALRSRRDHTSNQYFEFLSERLMLSIDIARAEPGVTERIDALARQHEDTHADTDGTWALQVGGLAYQAGTLGSMVGTIEAMKASPLSRTWHAAVALAQLMDGDRDAAAGTLAQLGEVPRNYFWLTVVQAQAEVAAGLGLLDQCERLFAELIPFRGLVGITASGSLCYGLVSRSAGELALALGRHGAAADLLEDAVGAADEVGMPFERVIARRLLAAVYRAQGRDDLAGDIMQVALAEATQRGFAREVHLLRAARAPR